MSTNALINIDFLSMPMQCQCQWQYYIFTLQYSLQERNNVNQLENSPKVWGAMAPVPPPPPPPPPPPGYATAGTGTGTLAINRIQTMSMSMTMSIVTFCQLFTLECCHLLEFRHCRFFCQCCIILLCAA